MDFVIEAADVARTLGRAQVPFESSLSRELCPADIARLSVEQGIKAPSVAKLSDRHHALAKCLAQGVSPGNASIMTGYSGSRISILKADPAFQDLIEFYRAEKDVAEANVLDRLSNLTLGVVSELEDRLENAPEDLKTRELLDIAVAGLDRTGHGPSSKVQVTTLTLTPEQMAKLSQGAHDPNVKIIEARAQGQRSAVSAPAVEVSVADAGAEGIAGEGDGTREISGESTPHLVSGQSNDDTSLGTVDTIPGSSWDSPRAAGSLCSSPLDGNPD